MDTQHHASRPGLSRRCASVLVLGLLAMAPAAHAQWRVVDNSANQKLNTVNDRLGSTPVDGGSGGTVTGNLREMYQQQRISSYNDGDPNNAAADEPEEQLSRNGPSSAVSMGEADRCPRPSAQGVAQTQWALCKEAYKTELAQYNYALQMYEVTRKRQEYLDQLKRERAGLAAHEIGKLQDNTNRLLILMSQMEIDRQQHDSYMAAYNARMVYLQQASKTLSQQALDGTRSDGGGGGLTGGGGGGGGAAGVVAGLAGAGALRMALEVSQSRRRHSF